MEKTPMMRIGLSGTAAVSCSRRGASKRPSVCIVLWGKRQDSRDSCTVEGGGGRQEWGGVSQNARRTSSGHDR